VGASAQAIADHNQLRLERELAGPPDRHSMTTTLNCAASAHRSSEGAESHRTTCSASTPGVAHERVLGDRRSSGRFASVIDESSLQLGSNGAEVLNPFFARIPNFDVTLSP
jgi:hypothetical protein